MEFTKKFSPLLFLASLGAGGMSVAWFAFLNFTVPHGRALINISLTYVDASLWQIVLYRTVEVMMVVFTLLHFVLTWMLVSHLIRWMKSDEYKGFIEDPMLNSGILTPFISFIMTLNVMLAVVLYFIPSLAENLQALIPYGMAGWAILWLALMITEIKLLTVSFTNSFDVDKVYFGWLLHPFALGMATVTGTGIAALSHDANIAHAAAFMSVISGTMGLFLLSVKLNSLFKSHFGAPGLPDKQFLPSLLIVVPNITLYGISMFRFGHYIEHNFAVELGAYFMVVMLLAFAFQTWYMAFGLSLMSDYIRNYLGKEFHLSQWGLICPLVAYSVMGIFLYKAFVPNILLYIFTLVVMAAGAWLFFVLLGMQLRCAKATAVEGEAGCGPS